MQNNNRMPYYNIDRFNLLEKVAICQFELTNGCRELALHCVVGAK
jgi:hypothetical protein